MVRRSTPSCDKRGGAIPSHGLPLGAWARDIVLGELPPARVQAQRQAALRRSTLPIVASEDNGGRLGNYADPVAEVGICRPWRSRQRFRKQK